MNPFPYMQFYIADYLSDAAHLTTIEHGAYLLLIFNYWQRGESFKANDQVTLHRRLSNIARMSYDEWQLIQSTLADFFEVTETEWRHKRIENDIATANAKSNKAKAAVAIAVNNKIANKQKTKQLANERLTNVERTLNECSSNVERTLNERLTNVERTFNHSDSDSDSDSDSYLKSKELKPFVAFSDREGVYSQEFLEFWGAYPLKKAKGAAWKAWQKLKPGQDLRRAMIRAIGEQLHERDLKTQAGLFCPEHKHPSTWLAQRCWEDLVTPDAEIFSATTPKKAPKESLCEQSRRIGEQFFRDLEAKNGSTVYQSDGGFLAKNDGVAWSCLD